jgi:hypothetical protein
VPGRAGRGPAGRRVGRGKKLTAESRELAADADLNVAHDPELSTSLALQALRLRSTSQAEDALRAALPNLQALRTFHDGSTVSSAASDPADPDIVAGADNFRHGLAVGHQDRAVYQHMRVTQQRGIQS